MICKKCGKEIPDGVAFCSACGAKIDEVAANNPNVVLASEKPKNKHKGLIIFCSIVGALLLSIVIFSVFDEVINGNDSPSNSISSSSDVKDFFKETFGDTEENVIKTLAISEIKKNLDYDSEVFDVKILDKDANYNYIVRGWTKSPDLIAKWWTVMVKLDISTGKMTTYTKGEFTESDTWINKYKTESEYGWGKENHIE